MVLSTRRSDLRKEVVKCNGVKVITVADHVTLSWLPMDDTTQSPKQDTVGSGLPSLVMDMQAVDFVHRSM